MPIRDGTIQLGDAVWIAAALLHHEQPDRSDFRVAEIEERLECEHIAGDMRAGVATHLSRHAVADRAPTPRKLRYLANAGFGRRRLFRAGDPYHPDREGPTEEGGARVMPRRQDIPSRYHYLIDWYVSEYTRVEPGDPILALLGAGRSLTSGEHPDEHVRLLRENWN